MILEQKKIIVEVYPVYIYDINDETFALLAGIDFTIVEKNRIRVDPDFFHDLCDFLEMEIDKYHKRKSSLSSKTIREIVEIISMFTTDVQFNI